MVDKHSKEARIKNMRAVKKRDTDIEKIVSSLLDSLMLKYQKNVHNLPGEPDFLLSDYKAVIFTHGCFWHHHNCIRAKLPTTNREFWQTKINKNVVRDQKNIAELLLQHWRVLVIWECALKGKHKLSQPELTERIEEWLCTGSDYACINTFGIKQEFLCL